MCENASASYECYIQTAHCDIVNRYSSLSLL